MILPRSVASQVHQVYPSSVPPSLVVEGLPRPALLHLSLLPIHQHPPDPAQKLLCPTIANVVLLLAVLSVLSSSSSSFLEHGLSINGAARTACHLQPSSSPIHPRIHLHGQALVTLQIAAKKVVHLVATTVEQAKAQRAK